MRSKLMMGARRRRRKFGDDLKGALEKLRSTASRCSG